MVRYRGRSRTNHGFAPYVSVGDKLAKGNKKAQSLAKMEKRLSQPVKPEGRTIARNFWGLAWCDHLSTMNDLDNRLVRGRKYLFNGSVVDLVITPLKVRAVVAGSSPYFVTMDVKQLPDTDWERIKIKAQKSVRSLVDFLSGKLDESVIRLLTDHNTGIFPKSGEIDFSCTCPDGAYVCKHVAAVFYGVGTLLDTKPELLFLIRNVDSSELIGLKAVSGSLEASLRGLATLENGDLGEMFGIELKGDPALGHRPAPVEKKGANLFAPPQTETAKKVGIQKKLVADKVKAKPTSKSKVEAPVSATPKQTRANSSLAKGKIGDGKTKEHPVGEVVQIPKEKPKVARPSKTLAKKTIVVISRKKTEGGVVPIPEPTKVTRPPKKRSPKTGS